jgi:hypothetical protein
LSTARLDPGRCWGNADWMISVFVLWCGFAVVYEMFLFILRKSDSF